jgi:hypothetical protein
VIKGDKKKKMSDCYQESMTLPLSWDYDDDVVGENDEDEDEGDQSQEELHNVLTAIEKVYILMLSYEYMFSCLV